MNQMITATSGDHAYTINNLAAEGKLRSCAFTVEGRSYTANSVWAATDWLKAQGHYAKGSIVKWEL